MLGNVEESSGGPEEIAVKILCSPHHEPCIVEKRVELIPSPESLFFGIARALAGLLGDGMELDRLLHFFNGALEIAGGLGELCVGPCLSGMYEQSAGKVVVISVLHCLQLLFIMFRAVEVDVVASCESLPIAREGSVFLGAASSGNQEQQQSRRNPHGPRQPTRLVFGKYIRRNSHSLITSRQS